MTRAGAGPRCALRYRRGVGFNPFRSHTTRRSDLLIVAIALAVIAALVLWGLFG
jgi:hypothetical protein